MLTVPLLRKRKEYIMGKIEGKKGYKKTELGWVPVEWEVCNLGSVLKEAQYGLSEQINHTGTYPILRMNNLRNGKIDISDVTAPTANC
jgi:hypothetical protein